VTKPIVEVITSTARLLEYSDLISNAKLLAVDTETNGLRQDSIAIGVSFSPSSDLGIYIPLLVYNKEIDSLVSPWSLEADELVRSWITEQVTKSQRLIGHNVPFDARILKTSLGIEALQYFKYDTQLIHHTVDENPPHGLKDLATKYLTEEASAPQDDLKASVIANGGEWKATNKEFYKGDVLLLGTYGAYDTIYTYGLWEKLWPQIEASVKLLKLWNEEVWPLNAVTYELNTTGFDVDIPYFEGLKKDITGTVESIEDEMYAMIADKVNEYEIDSVIAKTKFTKRSVMGKALMQHGWEEGQPLDDYRDLILKLFLDSKGLKRKFNFDSNDDKAVLLFDVLELPEQGTTAKGKRQVTAAVIDKLVNEYSESSEILKLMLYRSKEKKVLSTYVEAVLNGHEDGRIYTSFKQTGTTGGRFSSAQPINFQNLPRDDIRIKLGFKAPIGYKLISLDFSSLEPRIFSEVAGDPKLQAVYSEGLDFYSKIYVDMFNSTEYSARPDAPNYLGKLAKDKRQQTKPIALGIPYGMQEYKLAKTLNIEVEEAKALIDAYLAAYPDLAKWMNTTLILARKQGYIESKVGRRRRTPMLKELHDKYGIKRPDKFEIKRKVRRPLLGVEDPLKIFIRANGELNNARNFQIQSLAASLVNKAMIDFVARRGDLDAKIVSTVHDEVILVVKDEHVDAASKLLKDCMENNELTKLITVPMEADPVVGNNLAEAK